MLASPLDGAGQPLEAGDRDALLPDSAAAHVFRFRAGDRMFYYAGNGDELREVLEFIREHRGEIESGELVVWVNGYAVSFATPEQNLRVAGNRSNQVKSYLITHGGMREEYFRTYNRTVLSDRTLLAFRSIYSPGGEAAAGPCPVDAGLAEGEPVPFRPVEWGVIAFPDAPAATKLRPERFPLALAVKTNLLPWAAAVANLGVELGFGKHFSVDVPVNYSPYTVKSNYKFRVMTLQPEFRYWLKENFKGHFFGVHAHTGWFNIAVNDRDRYQDARNFYGFGLSYGYVLPITSHWGAEFTVGGGYVNTKYDVFYNVPNGARYDTRTRGYWGLTRAGISLFYKFNLR